MYVFIPFILSVKASLDDLDPGLSQGPAGKELTAGLKTYIYHDQTQTWCLWAAVCFPGRLILAANALSWNMHGKLLQEWWLAEPDRAARGGWWCQRGVTAGFFPPHPPSVINTPSLNCSWHIPVWGWWCLHPEWDSACWQMQPLWLTLVLPSLSLAECWSY